MPHSATDIRRMRSGSASEPALSRSRAAGGSTRADPASTPTCCSNTPYVCGPEGSHKDQCLRTIPPRENGGNMDVQQMQVGTTLLLPCFVDGCGLFVGDVHYAQGDGEVSGTAIEMGAVVTVRTEVLEGGGSEITGPHFEGADQKAIAPGKFIRQGERPAKPPARCRYPADLDGRGRRARTSPKSLAGRYARRGDDYIGRERPDTRAGVRSLVRRGRPRDRPGGGRAELHRLGDPRSRGLRIAVAARTGSASGDVHGHRLLS